MAPAEVQGRVAEIAWKVWPLVFSEGPQTLGQLRKKLNSSSDSQILTFALGWLAWENKIEIHYHGKTFVCCPNRRI